MSLYIDYTKLSESNHLDKLIYNNFWLAKYPLVILLLMYGPTAFALSSLVLYTRTLIEDVYIRRILGWSMILWTLYYNIYAWTYTYIIIESFREFIRFGVPYVLSKASGNLPTDPLTETILRRLFKISRIVNKQSTIISMQQIMLILTGYMQGDKSEAFSADEKKKFKSFFLDFKQTSFIYEQDTGSLCIFFPSFIIRFTNNGLQITNSDAMKMIKGEDSTFYGIRIGQ